MAKQTVSKKKATQKSAPDFSKYIRRFWILFSAGVIGFFFLFILASWEVFGEMPDHTVLENPKTFLATEIISSDDQTLGKFYLDDNRTPVDYDELPQHLVEALVATEDIRYYDHAGIDIRGTLRAAFAKMTLRDKGGASTITQQLAKQLFTKQVSSNKFQRAFQKIKEWVIAIRLERQYTKEEIIAMYFNIYDFGNNGDGIRSASRIYFGKEPMELDLKESAMLVGMFKNSSLYNPRPHRNPEGTKNRRNVVLSQLHKYEYITESLKDSLQNTALDLNYSPESHREGTATYFRAYLDKFMKDWIKENPKPDGSKYNLYNDGLKIYTTIDSRMQKYAEKAVAQHMPKLQAEFDHQNTPDRNPTAPFLELDKSEINDLLNRSMTRSERWRVMRAAGKSEKEIRASFQKPTQMKVFAWKDGQPSEIDTVMKPIDSMRYYKSFLQPGMMSMDPQTGHVKAWVGGMNYRHFQYDHVKQSKRQVGSTFKPFVYATAIDQLHLSPCDTLPRQQITIEADKYGNPEPWTTKNSDGKYEGFLTLKDALANSVNTITARLMDKVGPQPVIDMASNLGVDSDILPVPAISLGTPDISVYEMVAAYATFANKGVYNKPVMVTRIEDKNGTILYQFTPESKDVLSEEVAYTTVNLLEGVTQSGSGKRLRTTGVDKYNAAYREVVTGYPYEFDNPIAGKTGTTQNQSDGWFMGMVPNLVTGVWVGAEDRAAHFKSITYGQGATMALPIWGIYMKSCYADESLNISKEAFEKPKELSIEVDCEKWKGDSKAGNNPLDELDDVIDF
ncbi:penicillin-binding protein 1A [Psychroserpens sp.]|uniref:penicillin-binding protein 1A n=1 Tax=Psychroserpens sp. TaxID=2020870 RepID=UPI001B18BCAE|nr:transglycosylase domain-containing protein [Psychroserpens sp.]MBO6605447.1 transglycosylase domain-containing protein [Psychroserpens sp.]MBO6630085.1 transglycosylase domain-containing protein [Psychroserpens sp.]MBO6653744.1 transglycosylase domain-containing protein [Psychroserpens sp.]MBO6682065.1 transglycosylase domain-containing protein [Psychroserpens sp.]MBO6748821.1 transglycosylase domain-containing protein [Psychroserpens sp.]